MHLATIYWRPQSDRISQSGRVCKFAQWYWRPKSANSPSLSRVDHPRLLPCAVGYPSALSRTISLSKKERTRTNVVSTTSLTASAAHHISLCMLNACIVCLFCGHLYHDSWTFLTIMSLLLTIVSLLRCCRTVSPDLVLPSSCLKPLLLQELSSQKHSWQHYLMI